MYTPSHTQKHPTLVVFGAIVLGVQCFSFWGPDSRGDLQVAPVSPV